ncbi:radical SAM family heme chaperone HemW [Candidatus Dependentiae bacterium]|nr:radical SAM family heme chaperone HemW [Candidatus Dependentiae bacterium]
MTYSFRGLEHLYIHWPFCPYKCHFCDFVAMAAHEQFMIDYHYALCHEIKLSQSTIHANRLKTIYIGGGTPSTYPSSLLLDTFAILKKYFIFDEKTEVTIEVNPGTVTTELLKAWHSAGINRLSIGVQSLNDRILLSLNRHQTAQQVYQVLAEALEYFENISVDFILGLPGVTDEEWKEMIQKVVSWPIKHISIYFLMVQENTPLYFKVKTHKVHLPPDDATVDLYQWTVDFLSKYGFIRYELSNFAQLGFESRHNQAYWDRKSYRGYGLGACSFDGSIRFQNSKNLGLYIEQLKNDDFPPIESEEQLTPKQISMEKIMLGLRCKRGVSLNDCIKDFDQKQKDSFFVTIKELQEAGFLEYKEGVIYLTPVGFAVENEIAMKLFQE